MAEGAKSVKECKELLGKASKLRVWHAGDEPPDMHTSTPADQADAAHDAMMAEMMANAGISGVLIAMQRLQPYLPNPMLAPQPQSRFSAGTNDGE